MKRILFAAALAAQLPAAPALAEVMVERIEVAADITAIQDSGAASVWKRLPDDLETAIATRLADRIAADGAVVKIEIAGVSLAANAGSAPGRDGAMLTGDVFINMPGARANESYELTVTAEQAMRPPAAGDTAYRADRRLRRKRGRQGEVIQQRGPDP